MWRVTYPGAPRRCYRCGAGTHLARECRRPPLTMKQVEKMQAAGEVVQQEEDLTPGNSVPRSFAAVVKSDKFIQLAEEQAREAERLKQENLAKKILDERKKAEDAENREAVRVENEQRKRVEAEEKRSANLARLTEASRQASQYKEKMKILHEHAQSEISETNQYEKGIEEIAGLANPMKRPRPEMTSGGEASTAPNII